MQLLGEVGSPGWARTSDILINSQALYRLSYRGVARNPRMTALGNRLKYIKASGVGRWRRRGVLDVTRRSARRSGATRT